MCDVNANANANRISSDGMRVQVERNAGRARALGAQAESEREMRRRRRRRTTTSRRRQETRQEERIEGRRGEPNAHLHNVGERVEAIVGDGERAAALQRLDHRADLLRVARPPEQVHHRDALTRDVHQKLLRAEPSRAESIQVNDMRIRAPLSVSCTLVGAVSDNSNYTVNYTWCDDYLHHLDGILKHKLPIDINLSIQ